MTPYIISTERLGLRKWMETDIPPFAAMNKDADVMKYFPNMLNEAETASMVQRIMLHFDKHHFGLYAVENKQTRQFIGFTGFAIPTFEATFTPCIEIGWRFQKQSWGQGFATEAAKACLQYGFQALQFNRIVSFTSATNSKSERVMQKTGMIKTGEFDHPKIEASNILCRHVLYEIKKAEQQDFS